MIGRSPPPLSARWPATDRFSEAGLSKVHGPQSIVMDLHSFGQGLGVSTITLARHMAAFRTVKEEKETSRGINLHYEIHFPWHTKEIQVYKICALPFVFLLLLKEINQSISNDVLNWSKLTFIFEKRFPFKTNTVFVFLLNIIPIPNFWTVHTLYTIVECKHQYIKSY